MMTNLSPQLNESCETTPYLEAFKKLKRLKSLEPSLGILGFFSATFILICFFFYMDFGVVTRGSRLRGRQSDKFFWLDLHGSNETGRVGFLEQGDTQCDLFRGEWVWDETYPLYHSKDCGFLDGGFRCSENGRPDSFYTKWRWQPNDCHLPRFDAKKMLEKLRNRRLVFVGDSIGRNQWESLLCMLASAISDKDSIYEVNGSPITKHKGFLVFKFRNFNCTVEYYRAPFLVAQSRAPAGAPKTVKTTLKLDQMDWTSMQWIDADILVFNTGHWWNYEKTIRGGCYFQEGGEVNMEMSVESAYQRSIETVLDWIESKVNTSEAHVFFRTYAPVHFRGGDWRTGGSCHLETLPELGSSLMPSHTWAQFEIFVNVLSMRLNKSHIRELNVLNITHMTSRRKDGHLSLYYLGPNVGPTALHRQDCSHWCLPGVPDTWNELLYALLLKQDAARAQNSSLSSQVQV